MKFCKLADQLSAVGSLAVYHGTNAPWTGFKSGSQRSGYYPGFYVTTDKEIAKEFGTVVEFRSNLNIYRLVDADQLKNEAAAAGFERRVSSGFPEVQYLRYKGYDALQRGKEIVVFDTSKLEII